MFPVAETLQMLRFAELGGDLKLTGRWLFAHAARRAAHIYPPSAGYVPLPPISLRVPDERASHSARKSASSTN